MVPPASFSVNSSQSSLFPSNLRGRLFESANGKVYKLIKAVAGPLAAKDCVQLDVSEGNSYSVEQCAADGNAVGVVETPVSSGNFGYIVVGGIATCQTAANAGSSVAGSVVIPASSAGRVTISATATNGLRAMGLAVSTQGADAPVQVYLQGLS